MESRQDTGFAWDTDSGVDSSRGSPARAKVAALLIGIVAAVGIFAASQKSSVADDSQVSPSAPSTSESASSG